MYYDFFFLGLKTGDYHDDMNHENFMTWVKKQLLPNLPDRSVLIIDNAAYHNVTVNKNITTATKKGDMLSWLVEKGIPADPHLTKPELYQIIQENKFRFPPQYNLDRLLEQHGHLVLRLPPYHPELNPIEKIWALVKNWVAAHNTTFKLSDTEALTKQKFQEVSEKEWFDICQHVKKYEEELIKKEHIFDDTVDQLIFTVNTGSSDDSDEDYDDDDECDASLSEEELGCSLLD